MESYVQRGRVVGGLYECFREQGQPVGVQKCSLFQNGTNAENILATASKKISVGGTCRRGRVDLRG